MIINTSESLTEACKEIRNSDIIGVDTETNGLFAYRPRVCIIQISNGHKEWLVDAFAFETAGLAPLLDIFENASVLKILHGASHDIASLKEDYGRGITNIFDTYAAVQLLGYEKTGLSHLAERHCGALLSKKLQKADWGLRPLSKEACEYLRDDVRFLHRLHQIILKELDAAALVEEARIESRRIEETAPTKPTFDSDGFWRIKGIDELADAELAYLQELYIMRNRIASEVDRPAFKTIPDSVLVLLARSVTKSELLKVSFLHKPWMKPFLDEFFTLFEKTRNAARPDRRTRVATRRVLEHPVANRAVRDRLETALKDWRRMEALARKVSTMAVLPNHILEHLLFSMPKNLESLAVLPHFGQDRLKRYGPEILKIVSNAE